MEQTDSLSREQVLTYHDQGYLGPFDLLTEEEAAEYRRRIREDTRDAKERGADGPEGRQHRHRNCESVYELCTMDPIVDRMTDIYGRNLLLWESMLWFKSPGDAEVPWHQHYHHLPVEPKLSITAWIALTETTRENGCLQLVPGTNQDPYPETDAPEEVFFDEMTDPEYVDEDEAVTLEMEPGQFILFSELTLHRSFRNTSDDVREALAVRAVPPYVNIKHDELEDLSGWDSRALVLNGEDEYQLNDVESLSFGEEPSA